MAVAQELTPKLKALDLSFKQEAKACEQFQSDINKILKARQQFMQQQTENEIVKEELDLVTDASTVFKLIGPTLIKQDLVEAKANVSKRLGYIGNELSRLATQLRAPQEKLQRAQEQMVKLQQNAQRIQAAEAGKAAPREEEEG